ncbi:MAG TPA: glutathionylspermidine synthase family protein [Solirubrobacterales bacterium]|nr:glutathionylspermidine synthase family protein [Solirubrobacterales bacterium]
MDQVSDLKLQHLVELSKLGDGCAELEAQLEAWLAANDVVFAGHTIPFVLMPHFVGPRQIRHVRRAVESLCAVLNRFCEAYPDDERLQKELGLPTFEDSLVRVDPGYPRPLRICRLDAFLSGDTVKFLEFNADSPAGIGYTDVLEAGLRRTIALPRVDGEFDTAYDPMLPVLIDTLLDAFRAMRSGRREGAELPEAPRLALVDVPGSPSVPEFRIICAAAAKMGIEAIHPSTDELSYDGSVLRAGDQPVHLVYRRALIDDLAEGDLTAAYRDGAVCVVNPPRARVANNKKLMALLEDPRFAHLVGPREAEVIAATIPWTRILRPGRVTYGQWTVDLFDFVSDNRPRLVLKPASEYGGHDVALGIETEQGEWDRIIEEHAETGDFIVQEYVPVPEEMFPTVEDGHVQMRLKRFNINPFGIGGRYAGMITRISDRAVINVSAGGGLLPSVVGRHKRRLLADREGDEDLREEEGSTHGTAA